MKVIEILKSVGYNTPITDKRVLYALKQQLKVGLLKGKPAILFQLS